MIKGGYKIVNFNGAALSGTAETLPGIYDQIVDDYDKPVMVSGVSLNGDIMDDAYASVQEKIAGDFSKSVDLTVYGGVITVTEDDEVTFAVSKSLEELAAEIGDLDDLNTTEKGSAVGAINELNTGLSGVAERFVIPTRSLSELQDYIFAGTTTTFLFVKLSAEATNTLVGENRLSYGIANKTSATSARLALINIFSGKMATMKCDKEGDTFTWSEKYIFEGTAYTPA